ncbi:autophagy-related protein 16-1-like isoform X2 [Carettochelys insculpta]|uniref:autophagy-related protein 16-1-like isoform X2 n=1 Tax=Carettochelys insculpta TaxID=44489 RepID=UPI003EBA03B6
MEGAGPDTAWRRHVRRELAQRERGTRGLRGLVQSQPLRHPRPLCTITLVQETCDSDEKLLERRVLEQLVAESLQTELGSQESSAAPELVSLRLQHVVEVAELRGAQAELAQRVAHLSDALTRCEAECREHRARAGRCARELAVLTGRCQELHAELGAQRQEAGALGVALGAALGAREALETRWVQEKRLEAERLNEANAREERYQRHVVRLQRKLERLQLAAEAGSASEPGAELAASESSCDRSCEELPGVGPNPRQRSGDAH